jgi:small subunit ribosomal protein S15
MPGIISCFWLKLKMARMHSRKKGKSGSTRPSETKKKAWVKYDAKEIESLILKLNKSGMTKSQIGLVLRDSYGVPSVKEATKKSMGNILEKNKVEQPLPEDLSALIKRDIALIKHLEENKQDQTAKRGLRLTESKINRLVKYYKKSGRLPKDWVFNKDKARLLVG